MTKLTISQAARMLNQKGYKLGAGSTDLKKGVTSYLITTPSNDIVSMTTKEIIELVSN